MTDLRALDDAFAELERRADAGMPAPLPSRRPSPAGASTGPGGRRGDRGGRPFRGGAAGTRRAG